ncbi:MAG: hypothetical protein GXO23_02175 [Crenarchaeota archaeon]|nr:hypothetical protein [Thermoproteota archaeon]
MSTQQYTASRLLLKNIVESIANLAGDDALTMIFNIASHKTAVEMLKLANIDVKRKIDDPVEAFRVAYNVLRKYLRFDVRDIKEFNHSKIRVEIRDCECIFSAPELKIMDRVREILKSKKLCVLTLLACSLVEVLSDKVYVIESVECNNGNASIVLTSELL